MRDSAPPAAPKTRTRYYGLFTVLVGLLVSSLLLQGVARTVGLTLVVVAMILLVAGKLRDPRR